MNNFEYITKDFETFKMFAEENNWDINCEICRDSGLPCSSSNCEENLIKFLTLEKSDKGTGIENTEWLKYNTKITETTRAVGDRYFDVNLLVNRMRSWVESGEKLNANQKSQILELKKSYEDNMKQLKRLEEVFSTVEKMD